MAPACAIPVTSPLTSAMNTGTPASEKPSASTLRVTVLPVPVAPAMRPWRLAWLSSRQQGTSPWATQILSLMSMRALPRRRVPLPIVPYPWRWQCASFVDIGTSVTRPGAPLARGTRKRALVSRRFELQNVHLRLPQPGSRRSASHVSVTRLTYLFRHCHRHRDARLPRHRDRMALAK